MKIFVETKDTQGLRKSDFCLTKGNEPVIFAPLDCDRDRDNVDGPCGCRRSLVGVFSSLATTTFTVSEVALTKSQYLNMVRNIYITWGWSEIVGFEDEVQINTELLLGYAEYFPVGFPLERRGSEIQIRNVGMSKRMDLVFSLLLKRMVKSHNPPFRNYSKTFQ
jgi:hypothetical protein